MYYLSSICFMCLKSNSLTKLVHKEADIGNASAEKIKYVLPELTIFESNTQFIYICISCLTGLNSYYTFKKMCLKNYSQFKNYLKILQGTNDTQEQRCTNLSINYHENFIKQEPEVVKSYAEEVKNLFLPLEEEDKKIMLVDDIKKELEDVDSEDEQIFEIILNCDLQNGDESRVKVTDTTNLENSEVPQPTDLKKPDIKDFGCPNYLQQHKKKHFGDYKCGICHIKFSHKSSMQRHMKYHTGTKKYYECTRCTKKFTRNYGLQNHLKYTRCSVSNDARFLPHMKICEGKYECLICSKNFSNKYHLQRHVKMHTGIKDFECAMCTKKFAQNYHLQRHIKVVHVGIRDRNVCCICNKKFTRHARLLSHMKVEHNLKDFQCPICTKQFDQNHSFQCHLKTHIQKNYKCSVCGKMFLEKGTLSRHEKFHKGIKNFECLTCNTKFFFNFDLKRHMKSHKHIIRQNNECEKCHEKFGDENELKIHKRCHEPAKEFQCPKCNKKYKRNYDLKRHMVVHSKMKTYKCSAYDKKQNENLQKHIMELHAKDFVCTICNCKFSQEIDWENHKKTHDDLVEGKKNQQLCDGDKQVDYLIIYGDVI